MSADRAVTVRTSDCMNKILTAIALVLVTVTALFVMVNDESEGSTQQIGTDFYYIVTDANSRTYSTAPSDKVYIDCDFVRADAFKNCTNVKSIYCSEKVKRVDARAFQGCTNLSFISLPGATSIGEYAFYNSGITRVWVQPCLTSIGAHAFENCSRFTDMLTWQSSVKTFGDSVFKNSGLREIDLRGITSIASNAFEGCTKLKWQFLSPGETGIPNVDRIVCSDDVRFRNIFDADYGMQLEVERYQIFTVRDDNGDEQRNEYWENIPNYFNRIYMERGHDYRIDLMVHNIHFPEELGIEDLRVDCGVKCDLPVLDLGDLHHDGWTIDGLEGTFSSLSASQLNLLGSDIQAIPIIIGSSTVTFDHSDLPEALDVTSLETKITFGYGDTYPDLGEVDGYRHIGWSVDGIDVGKTSTIKTFTAHTTKSVWGPTELFNVIYQQSDGTEILREQSPKWVQVPIKDTIAEEEIQERFIGWSIQDMEGPLVSGDMILIDSEVVLVPVFEDRMNHDVLFLSGDALLHRDSCYDGREYTITIDDPTEDLRDFMFWNVGGELMRNGDSFIVTGNVTLNAVWKNADTVIFTFHLSEEDRITNILRKGTIVTISQEPEAIDGMEFLGWSTDVDSVIAEYEMDSEVTASEDMDFHPVWEVIEVPDEPGPEEPGDEGPADPEEPTEPEKPDEPTVPEKPEEPETPVEPDVPTEPVDPSPGDSKPEEPTRPSVPDTPSVPDRPTVPEVPDEPETPEVPDDPDTDAVPEIPDGNADDDNAEHQSSKGGRSNSRPMAIGVAAFAGAIASIILVVQIRRS